MFGLRALDASEWERPLLLLAAFAVVLLAGISTTMATTASAPSLIEGLWRDLGAVRAQLEREAPEPLGAGQRSVAFNTDLGDGGLAFRHRSMATILRSARRRLENLVSGYRKAGDARRAGVAQNAQLELQELDRRVHDLDDATDSASIWARQHLEAEQLLDRLQDALVVLTPGPRSQRDADRG